MGTKSMRPPGCSLLIALLRAANIPARYAYGTIQIPAGQAMNWVGGVKTPEAAQSLLAQGGIPNRAVIEGGKITAFKLEHVWVEAYVDYIPSRGAINKQGDSWVAMDASFKQYDYTNGMAIKTAVPFDAPGLLSQAQQGATVNDAEGWVQNLDQNLVQTALADYQNRVKAYVGSQKANATVGDMIGTKTVVAQTYSMLMGTLPYRTIATSSAAASLPDKLHFKLQINLYASSQDRAWGNPSFKL